jgi:hypothetical protein
MPFYKPSGLQILLEGFNVGSGFAQCPLQISDPGQ